MDIRALVVDLDHADGSREENGKHIDLIDWQKVKGAGFLGVIHKATEGERFVDALYKERRTKAMGAGLLWGAYHFMRPGDVGNQVSHFLTVTGGPVPGFTLFALDYEDERCSLWQADRWLELVHIATKQRPWLYGGGVLKDQLARIHRQTLGQYPLWLSEYGPVARVPLPWERYTLWQRSGDGEGPGVHDVPGIGRKEDINYFAGTDDQFKSAWMGVA